MSDQYRGIDEIIQQAIRAGAFDNLPGKGQPLRLEENPYLDPEWQLAYHLLKENGFAPDFIQQRQAIEQELAAAREALARSWAWRQQALTEGRNSQWVEVEWEKARVRFSEQIESLNGHIRDYNLQVPTSTLARKIVKIDLELKKFVG